jgi:hypothetical protein
VSFRAVTTTYVDTSLSSTCFDEFTWPMTQTEVFKCVIDMLQVLWKDITDTSYSILAGATLKLNDTGEAILRRDKPGSALAFTFVFLSSRVKHYARCDHIAKLLENSLGLDYIFPCFHHSDSQLENVASKVCRNRAV